MSYILTEDLLSEAIESALDIIAEHGGTDSGRHQWVLDQIVRKLTGNTYEYWVKDYCSGDQGPNTYVWTTGDPP